MKTTGKRTAWIKKVLLPALTLTIAAVLYPSNILTMQVQAAVEVENPRIVEDPSMRAGQKVTWDYVWFGSYPQSEVVSTAMSRNYTAVNSSYFSQGDIFVSDSVYSNLTDAAHESEWSNNEIVLDGERYRRIKKGDATYATGGASQYNWANSTDYHYFKYEPIRWRVLSTDGETAFLLSDLVLDDQRFHAKANVTVNWGTSSIRAWLNGTFFSNAFTSAEQGSIVNTTVLNQANVIHGTSSGANTTDRIFLLSQSEIGYTEEAAAYGFVEDLNTSDEARGCKSSTYAKAMGLTNDTAAGYAGNCKYWLRSTGSILIDAAIVYSTGIVTGGGYGVTNVYMGIRPALKIQVSSKEYNYGGTISSDGTITVYKEEPEIPPAEEEPEPPVEEEPEEPEEPPVEEEPEEPEKPEEPPVEEEPEEPEKPEEPPVEEEPEEPAEGGNFDGDAEGNGIGYQPGDGTGTGIGAETGYVAIGRGGTGIGSDRHENTNVFARYHPAAQAGEISRIKTQAPQVQEDQEEPEEPEETWQVAVQRGITRVASTRSAWISDVHTDEKVQAAMSAAGGGGSRVKLYELENEPEELPETEEKPRVKWLDVLAMILLAAGIVGEGTYFKRQKRK